MYSEQINKVLDEMTTRGDECGVKIGEILKELHPEATIFTLYRSAVAIQKKDSLVMIYSSGDPHAMGEQIDLETIKKWEKVYAINGDRWGVTLNKMIEKEFVEMKEPRRRNRK